MVSRILICSSIALSAVCAIEIASFALLMAWPRALACERKESAIAIPDASSAAVLILKPVESFSKELLRLRLLAVLATWAFIAATFVLIRKLILNPFKYISASLLLQTISHYYKKTLYLF